MHRMLLLAFAIGCEAEPASNAIAICDYQNQFASGGRECREYTPATTLDNAETHCLDEPESTFTPDERCEVDGELGRCLVEADGVTFEIVNEGTDVSTCDDLVLGCELFAGGTFLATALCEGEIE